MGNHELKIFIDDERDPPDQTWMLARTNEEAVRLIDEFGYPSELSLDHDLGRDENGLRTTFEFVKWLALYHFYSGPPKYVVHSVNPVGRDNIISYMTS